MARYIELDALIEEIENKIEKYTKRGEESDAKRDGHGMYWGGVLSCLNEIRTLCDTLEAKEVDLENSVKGRIDYPLIGVDFPNIYPNYKELKDYCDKNGINDEDEVKIIIIKQK